jgi:hypothetical protein
MDLEKYLRELKDEKRRLDRVIGSLEELLEQRLSAPPSPLNRRGRKPGMSDEERRRISDRMRQYWAQRNLARKKAED